MSVRLIKESGYAVVADDVFDKLFRLIDTVGGGGNDDVLILSNDVRDVGVAPGSAGVFMIPSSKLVISTSFAL